MCTSPSSSKLLKASHQRDLLFRFLKAQPHEAQVHLQRALGIETEAVQLDVWSLLPLLDTKEIKAVQTSSRCSSPRVLVGGYPKGLGCPPSGTPLFRTAPKG